MMDSYATKPHSSESEWNFDRVFRLLLAVAVLVSVFALLRYLADVLIPFAVALLLAFLLNPIVNALESRIKRRTPAVLITVFGCGIVGFSVMLILIHVGSQELASFQDLLRQVVIPSTAEESRDFGTMFDEFVENQSNPVVRNTFLELRRQIDEQALEDLDLIPLARRAVRFLAPNLLGFFSGLLSFFLGLTGLIVILLYLVFLLIDYPRISKSWQAFLPPAYRANIIGFIEDFRLAMGCYFRGQFLVALIVGVLFAIGFGLIGLRMAILLGLGIGLLNMVPYLQTVGTIPALLLGLVHGLETNRSLLVSLALVLLVFAVVQTIQDTLLTPRIVGRSVGLRPVALLLGIFIWGKLLGFLGLVLAIPLTCLGLTYYKRFVLDDRAAETQDANGKMQNVE